MSESLLGRVTRRLGWVVRDTWPDRAVTREVQGVQMTLPWSHRLPDYVRMAPAYGQNLVDLAELLDKEQSPLTVLDVGANIGDSTLQILAATDARVLCVEADGFYLDYLHRNVDGDARVTVQESLLTTGSVEISMAPVRGGGTTHFEPGVSAATAASISTEELRTSHPAFASLRLAKSDTDGYDVQLIPAIARTWAESRPVLFFEYDHTLSWLVGNDPLEVWPELEQLGYETVVAWDNYGRPIGRFPVAEAGHAAAVLDVPGDGRAHTYWDVAVVHGSDAEGLAAIASLVP